MRTEQWIGFRTGKLTIVGFDGLRRYEGGGALYFRFRCDCGREFVAQKSNVVNKREDCGCSRPPATRTAPAGAWHHPLYRVWSGMLHRCQNPNSTSYKDYGARGVYVCDRWKTGAGSLTGFECFVTDMGDRPKGNFTVERVDGTGPYAPGNCVWLPKSEQSKNRRGVLLVRMRCRTQTIPDWCAELGIGYWTVKRRIARGWPPDKALTEPVHRAAS